MRRRQVLQLYLILERKKKVGVLLELRPQRHRFSKVRARHMCGPTIQVRNQLEAVTDYKVEWVAGSTVDSRGMAMPEYPRTGNDGSVLAPIPTFLVTRWSTGFPRPRKP